MSELRVVMFLIFTLSCHCVSGVSPIDWILHQKLRVIDDSLIVNGNLPKFINFTQFDNYVLDFDVVKAKRSYDNDRCIKDLQWIQGNINNTDAGWTSDLFKVWGKLPSTDYVTDYGNFEQCLNILPMTTNKSTDAQTQYCILQGLAVETNEIFMKLGICIPHSCAPSLIAAIMNEYLNETNRISINIPTEMCQLRDDNIKILPLDKIVIIFIISLLTWVILCSIYDVTCNEKEEKNPFLVAFSAISNSKELFSCSASTSPAVISCFHGIRVIAAHFIIFGHLKNYMVDISLNPIEYKRIDQQVRSFEGGVSLSVDSFLLLGGILVSKTVLNHLSTANSKLNLHSLYIRRYLRFMPVLAFAAVFQLTLLKFVARGPNYHKIDWYRKSCQNAMWHSFFFISNYFTKSCVGTSWYLSMDMQLFVLSPFLVILMRRNYNIFLVCSILLMLIHCSVIISTPHDEWNPGFWESLYFLTHNRYPSWLIGLNFGYFLYRSRTRKYSIPKHIHTLIMTASVFAIIPLVYYYVVFGFFQPLFRIVWTLPLCYIIFACVNGHGGAVNSFLSLPQWQPLSRLSFVAFLIHLMVIEFINVNMQNGVYVSKFIFIEHFLTVSVLTHVVATIIVLTIEMPAAALIQRHTSKYRTIGLILPSIDLFKYKTNFIPTNNW